MKLDSYNSMSLVNVNVGEWIFYHWHCICYSTYLHWVSYDLRTFLLFNILNWTFDVKDRLQGRSDDQKQRFQQRRLIKLEFLYNHLFTIFDYNICASLYSEKGTVSTFFYPIFIMEYFFSLLSKRILQS